MKTPPANEDHNPDQNSDLGSGKVELPPLLWTWKQAVESGDKADVVALYHTQATLKGTMWGHISRRRVANDNVFLDGVDPNCATIEQYFDEFMEGKHSPIVSFNGASIHSQYVPQPFNLYAGDYTFN